MRAIEGGRWHARDTEISICMQSGVGLAVSARTRQALLMLEVSCAAVEYGRRKLQGGVSAMNWWRVRDFPSRCQSVISAFIKSAAWRCLMLGAICPLHSDTRSLRPACSAAVRSWETNQLCTGNAAIDALLIAIASVH